MGVLNRTPDSFSDGGAFVDEGVALARARRMLEEGADLIDVGAESTRPGAPTIEPGDQIARLGRTIEILAREGAICSIDTTSPEVARVALGQGARVVNIVDPTVTRPHARLARELGADLLVMHCRGRMSDMRGFSDVRDDAYEDVATDVAHDLERAVGEALEEGLDRAQIAVDPGLGFGKNARHSLELCARLDRIVALGFPVVVGASRKSFLTAPLVREGLAAPSPTERLGASVAAAVIAAQRGAACVRVHDVAATRQALAFATAVEVADA